MCVTQDVTRQCSPVLSTVVVVVDVVVVDALEVDVCLSHSDTDRKTTPQIVTWQRMTVLSCLIPKHISNENDQYTSVYIYSSSLSIRTARKH